MNTEKAFVYRTATVVLALVILGAGAVFAYLVLDGDETTQPPPGVTLLLGAALVQMANLVREGTNRVLTDGIKTNVETTNTGVQRANEKLDDAKAALDENGDSVKARQEQILEELAEIRREHG